MLNGVKHLLLLGETLPSGQSDTTYWDSPMSNLDSRVPRYAITHGLIIPTEVGIHSSGLVFDQLGK
jgi:hypothetical protein